LSDRGEGPGAYVSAAGAVTTALVDTVALVNTVGAQAVPGGCRRV